MAKILLADDSATMQKVVDVVLRGEGFEVKAASNGTDALKLVESFKPDMVLVYIKLPGINGYDLAHKIKTSPANMHIPVCLLAGAFDPVDENRKRQAGAEASLIKPFQTDDLLKMIRTFLPSTGGAAAGVAAAEDEIVFDMSGGEEEEAVAVEAEAVEAEIVEAEAVEAEVYEAEVVEAEALEAEVVEAAPAPKPAPRPAPQAMAAAAPVQMPPVQMPTVQMPSSEELSAMFMKTVEEKVVEALKGAEIRDAIVTLLEPHMKETVSNILIEAMPELTQKLLREMVSESLSMLNRELENIMWETVPELAEAIIRKEIEKIRSER